MDKEINQWKLLYTLGLFLATFVSYLTPIVIIRKQQLESWTLLLANPSIDGSKTYNLLSACNCLSAGIFLGISFLDLMPFIETQFKDLLKTTEIETDFPVAQSIIILGVFLVLTLETILRDFLNRDSPPVLKLEDENSNKIAEETQDKQELIQVSNDEKETEKFIVERHGCPHCVSHSHDFNMNSMSSFLTFSLLIFAKSVHSIFEGLALGLLNDLQIAWRLFIAVILHECLIAFALGLSSQRIEFQMKTNIKFAFVFSITIPLGIGFGVLMGYTPGLLGRTISVVFQALSAGTFIHVTFNELIASELMSSEFGLNTKQKLFKIFLLFIGFCFMALITVLTEESH